VIRSVPANHLEQAASFILEWNGMTLAFSGDTLPNKWWIENTQGVDFAIHECFLTPELAIEKWKFSPEEAMNALTKIHATAALFGKVMAMTNPKHAVAYHFQNDADTLPGVMDAVQQVYDGPVDYAQDFMVWNITRETSSEFESPSVRGFAIRPEWSLVCRGITSPARNAIPPAATP
jgi:ribonuclease Z